MGTGSRSGACPCWDRHPVMRHPVPAGTGTPPCAILAGRRP
ncbi:hypothetical protein L505_4601 [Bordetella bronchiseptica F4563]|nr:hypothetical protein L505_4601 [Bordetella bronchiseptica F4563]